MKQRRVVLAVLIAAAMAVIVPTANADPTSSCTDGVLPVSFGPGRPNTLSIVNRLCHAASSTSTVHVLVSGSALPLVYWDPAYQPERYSMVRVLNASGLDTYTYDRVGTAASSKPPSFMVDTAVDVWNLHQIVQHLRRTYERVITGGVSSGAVIAAREAAQFHDVDGVVLMGMLHQLDAVRLGLAAPAMKPAILDPRWTTSGLDPGYVTFGDVGFAIEPDDTDPGMAAYLEGLVDVITGTQQATLLPYILVTARDETRAIDVTVLVAVGQRDTLMCGPMGTDCSDAASVMRAEAPFYADAARLETFVLTGAGHSMNSERNAPEWFVAEAEWAQRVVLGTRDQLATLG